MILIWLWKRLNKTGARPEVSGRLLRRFPKAEINKLLLVIGALIVLAIFDLL